MFCINETLISIKPRCKDAEAFALLTRTCWGLSDAGANALVASSLPFVQMRAAGERSPTDIRSCRCAVQIARMVGGVGGGWGRSKVRRFNDVQFGHILRIIFTATFNTREAPLPPTTPTSLHTDPASCLKYVVHRSTRHPPAISHTAARSRRAPTLECGAERQAVRVLRWLPWMWRDPLEEVEEGRDGEREGWREGGRQRHIEADAEKCERVSVRLAMTRSWLRRAGEATALALTHLIPTGPPG